MGARPSSFRDSDGAAVVEKEDAPKVAPRKWSGEQKAIFEWFAHGSGHLVVRARAGTGKTTTILEGIERAPEDFIGLVAFNSRIAKELKERLSTDKAIACTLHSLGLQAIRKKFPKVTVDSEGDRARALTNAVVPEKMVTSTRRLVTKLHTLARERYPHTTDASELIELAINEDCVPPGERANTIAEFAFLAMEEALKPTSLVDFADMIFLSLRLGLLKPRFNLLVVDETQDMNEVQTEMAFCVLEPGGRMAVVGDDRQAIYAFRGADSTALDRLKEELGATELPLNVTYRCATSIVAEAQALVGDIEARKGAPKGIVDTVTPLTMFTNVQPGDFILSRTNAPLVRVVMGLLRSQRRARIEGRDVGKMLLGHHTRFSKYGDVRDVITWEANMDDWAARELRRANEREMQNRIDAIVDLVETLRAISDGAQNTEEIGDRIAALFDDDVAEKGFIIGSTVHKAKGLEANVVWILQDTFNMRVNCECGHRHPFKTEDPCVRCGCDDYKPNTQAGREEENIHYVAITRAKSELYFVRETDAAR